MTATEHPISLAVAFPTSNPDGETSAHVERDASLDDVPTWSLQTLNAGPARSSLAYGRHLEATIGSSYDWSDEFRFDKRTGKLRSFVLKVPEAGALEPAIARSWLAVPRRTGVPVLDHRENGFHVDPLDLRHLTENAAALVVASATLPSADRDSLRLAIGRDSDLLFHRGRYRGWILGSPIAHLVREPGETTPGTDDPRLHEPLREYLALVVEPNIARMGDEDPDLCAALRTLRSRLGAIDGTQARALEGSLERVLETFYPE
jgi:hypothetical protein